APAAGAPPPHVPPGIAATNHALRHGSGALAVADLRTAAPATPADDVAIVNAAPDKRHLARPRRNIQNCERLTVAPNRTNDRA
ncbi:FAD-linked oxidase, partial [Burkholderia pseudomallei]